MEKVIEVKNLKRKFKIPNKEFMEKASFWKKLFFRKYDEFWALKDVSFELKKGEILGYIGRNGAGKTTTIKILTGILSPTEGKVNVLGFNPYKERIKVSFYTSVLFGNRSYMLNIPLKDTIEYYLAMYGYSWKDMNDWIEYLIQLLELDELLNIPGRKMSFGQRKRADLLIALINKPKILFLDEPTIGLDIFTKEKIREFLLAINKKERISILITSHYMEDIEKLADRIVLIDEGKTIWKGKIEDLIKKVNYKKVEIVSKNPKFIYEMAKKLDVKELQLNKNKVTFFIKREKIKEIKELINEDIVDIKLDSPSLENLIKELYEELITK
jgi:ABC-2 type transport system ATP-binding protein